MSTAESSVLDVLARSLVTHECAQRDLSERAATTRTITKIFSQLVPLIGSAGVLALFARSVLATQPQCKALEGFVHTRDSIDAARAEIDRCLATIPISEVAHAGTTLVASFLTLTSKFIGERLTLQLLQNAWPMIALVKEPK